MAANDQRPRATLLRPRSLAGARTGPATDDSTHRRERVLLLVLAAVQFTSIVDFMVVMPLGPQLRRTLEISPVASA